MKEKYLIGDWVKLISKRAEHWNSKGRMDKFLGRIVQIENIIEDRLIFADSDGWAFALSDIDRPATKEEVNNSKPSEVIPEFLLKRFKVVELLAEMINADKKLYEKILKSSRFAKVFAELVDLARQ